MDFNLQANQYLSTVNSHKQETRMLLLKTKKHRLLQMSLMQLLIQNMFGHCGSTTLQNQASFHLLRFRSVKVMCGDRPHLSGLKEESLKRAERVPIWNDLQPAHATICLWRQQRADRKLHIPITGAKDHKRPQITQSEISKC